jgi:hypothetical protein
MTRRRKPAAHALGARTVETRMRDFVGRLSPEALLVAAANFALAALRRGDAEEAHDRVRSGLRMAAQLAQQGHAGEVRGVAGVLDEVAARFERDDAPGAEAALDRLCRECRELSRDLLESLDAVVSPRH